MSIRVLITDDHILVLSMLRSRLEAEPSFEVVATATSAGEAVELSRRHEPDVILMDIDMPGVICFDAVKTITTEFPNTGVIFLSAHTHDNYIEQALRSGALGYLTKRETPEDIIEAIKKVASDEACFSPEIGRRIEFEQGGLRIAAGSASRVSSLTPRELQVLSYTAQGMSAKEMASKMHVGVRTVQKHTENLMEKLDIHDRVKLTRFAIAEGLVYV